MESLLQVSAHYSNWPVHLRFRSQLFLRQIWSKIMSHIRREVKRAQATFAYGTLADLGAGLTLHGGQPLLVTLEPKANSGSTPIVHTGHEFVFCLDGQLAYTIEGSNYILNPGDSLLFEAHLPHFWQNVGESTSQSLLIMCPADESDHPTECHFKAE